MNVIRNWETWVTRNMPLICLLVTAWDTTEMCQTPGMQSMVLLASDEFQWQCFIPSESKQGQCPDFALSICHATTVTWSHPYHSCSTVICECNDAVLELAVCLRSFQLNNLDFKKKKKNHYCTYGNKGLKLVNYYFFRIVLYFISFFLSMAFCSSNQSLHRQMFVEHLQFVMQCKGLGQNKM